MRTVEEHPVFAGVSYRQVAERARFIRSAKKKLNSYGGVILKGYDPCLVPSSQPFNIAEANFYLVHGQQWTPDPAIALGKFPLRTDCKEGAIVPVIGGFYIGNRKLSNAELQKAGLTPIRDMWGKMITFPYFVPDGARISMDVSYRCLQILGKIIDQGDACPLYPSNVEPFIPGKSGDLDIYINLYCHLASKSVGDLVAEVKNKLTKYWEDSSQNGDNIDFNIYKERFFWVTLLTVVSSFFAKTEKAQFFPSCALQFKGNGGQYAGRWQPYEADGNLILRPGEVVLDSPDNVKGIRSLVGSPALIGSFGIFLDQIHQPLSASPDPVGGILAADTEAINLDLRLLRQGAVMGGISLSSIRLLEADTIRRKLGFKGYESQDLHVLCRAAGSDTRRLQNFLREDWYDLYISEHYGSVSEDAKICHLKELAENLGKNIRAIFACKLTGKFPVIRGRRSFPPTANNLSPVGAIYDSTELISAQNARECGDLISLWIMNLFETGQAAGFSAKEFFSKKTIFEALMEGVTGQSDSIPQAVIDQLKDSNAYEIATQISLHCISLWERSSIE